MSSHKQSPPGTPRRVSVKNDLESLTPRAPGRTTQTQKPLPTAMVTNSLEQNDSIPVRSTQPIGPSEFQADENGQSPHQAIEDVEGVDDDDDAELTTFDWADLENRYMVALTEANKIEDDLNQKFDSYADAFQVWSQTSAQRDNERAQKRLKTRTLHVQLREMELENKKQHYVNVVEAFKNALKLLKSPSPMR